MIAPGALADLLVVDGNPLEDLGVFQDQGAHIPVVMQDGRFHRNRLGAGLTAGADRPRKRSSWRTTSSRRSGREPPSSQRTQKADSEYSWSARATYRDDPGLHRPHTT